MSVFVLEDLCFSLSSLPPKEAMVAVVWKDMAATVARATGRRAVGDNKGRLMAAGPSTLISAVVVELLTSDVDLHVGLRGRHRLPVPRFRRYCILEGDKHSGSAPQVAAPRHIQCRCRGRCENSVCIRVQVSYSFAQLRSPCCPTFLPQCPCKPFKITASTPPRSSPRSLVVSAQSLPAGLLIYLQAIGQVPPDHQRNFLLVELFQSDGEGVGQALHVDENGCVAAVST